MSHSLSKKFTFGSLLMFALPTTIMMVVMSLYTIVDGVFVSRYVSTNALSSINIVYPVINIVLGISVMLSTGSSAIVAKKMGEGRPDSARQTFTTIILLNIGLGLVIALFGNLAAVPLSRLLGASELLLEDCVTYLRWQLAFAPALMLQILFQMYFVTEGRPGIGLFLTLLAGVSNALLDYLLIVPLGLGIAGAAIATVTGYMIPAVIGLLYFACSRRSLWLVRPRMERGELKDTCINGSSEMVTNLSSGIITFLFNLAMMHFAGEDGVAAITIIQYSQFLLNALFMGFSQGVSPVISFNYGSKNHNQLKQVFRTSLIFTAVTSLATFLLAQVTGSLVVGVFARPGTAVYALTRHGFTIFAFSFLFSGLTIFASALFTALSDGRISAVISFVRTFGLIITSLLVLPFLIGIDGVWLAIPIAEFGGVMLSIYYMKKLKDVYRYA
ncbi:MATE family efflux transporter [Enterocloster citroniae]|uniref:MATE family efflux transporter n=1 Tax=Enterocloster citroniae TaxID=358743 RepID=UPI001D09160E|nr:MATE family efflux transporter [Enterocloster citroniae]MCB7066818.1 MATE family efflux transporter [Enterocloster citroniae]